MDVAVFQQKNLYSGGLLGVQNPQAFMPMDRQG